MLYCVVYFVPSALAKQVQPFREEYDPTAHLIEPHLTIVFPLAGLSKELVTRHVERVLRSRSRFTIQFTGLGKSWDHWLLLLVRRRNKTWSSSMTTSMPESWLPNNVRTWDSYHTWALATLPRPENHTMSPIQPLALWINSGISERSLKQVLSSWTLRQLSRPFTSSESMSQ
jgi:hypothetical protein